MTVDSDILRYLWFGAGFLGMFILAQNPAKRVFESNFWGSMFKTLFLILVPLAIIGGPITLAIILVLPKRKLCPLCYKAISKEATICTYCSEPILIPDPSKFYENSYTEPARQFSPQIKEVISKGSIVVNLPVPFVMFGFWLGGAIIGVGIFDNFNIALISFPVGFIAGWLWWSFSVPRWRKWALREPGVTPDELQAAAEIALLVWPKGHFFERTEIGPKD